MCKMQETLIKITLSLGLEPLLFPTTQTLFKNSSYQTLGHFLGKTFDCKFVCKIIIKLHVGQNISINFYR